jgi:hypothetical protein
VRGALRKAAITPARRQWLSSKHNSHLHDSRATSSRKVEGIVLHEFISEDPLKEMIWAEKLAAASGVPMALVGLADFADPGLSHHLDVYRAIPVLFLRLFCTPKPWCRRRRRHARRGAGQVRWSYHGRSAAPARRSARPQAAPQTRSDTTRSEAS